MQEAEEPFETFNAYTDGLKKFVEAHIGDSINFRMNNDINKIKITISNLPRNYNSANLYNESNPINDHKVNMEKVQKVVNIIRNKQTYIKIC